MTADAATSEVPSPKNLLADLESRQDELLRLLGELEERTKQALANLTASAASSGAATTAKPAHDSSNAPAAIVAASAPIVSAIAPSVSSDSVDEKKSAKSNLRSRTRKAA